METTDLDPQPVTAQECKLEPWLVWLAGLRVGLKTKRLPVQFPVRTQAWDVGQVPSWGRERQLIAHTLVFLSLSFFLPSSLSKK